MRSGRVDGGEADDDEPADDVAALAAVLDSLRHGRGEPSIDDDDDAIELVDDEHS